MEINRANAKLGGTGCGIAHTVKILELEHTIMTWAPLGKGKYGEVRDLVFRLSNNALFDGEDRGLTRI